MGGAPALQGSGEGGAASSCSRATSTAVWFWRVGLTQRGIRARVLAAALALALLLAGELALETPLSESLRMVPARVSAWAAPGAPLAPHECAPCGCARHWGAATAAAFAPACAQDEELEALSLSDRGPQGATALAAAAALQRAVSPKATSVEACHGILSELHSRPSAAAPAPAAPALWHVYWKPDTVAGFHAVHAAAIEAWLVSQPENSLLVMWVPVPQAPPAALLPLLRAFPHRLRIRALDILWEARGSPVEGSYMLRLTDKHSWIDSDFARMVLLWRYGGFYSDMDMLLLRDATPLLGLEFLTEFACWGGTNGAVLRMFARGATATALLELASAMKPRLAMWTSGPWLLEKFRATPLGSARLHMLPWCFYHGIWCGALPRGALEGAQPWSREQLDGVYGLHLHGAAKEGGRIDPNSILGTKMVENRAELLQRLARGGDAGKVQLAPLFEAPQRGWWWW